MEQMRDRIVVDCHQYNLTEHYRAFRPYWSIKKVEPETDDDFLICSHVLRGFSLKTKLWGLFDVSQIEDVDFDEEAFDALVLSPERKRMIESLVKMQDTSIARFDDLIKGKGRGIVFLLHGPPGTGKTFTAGTCTMPF